jgi:hypothetical protein
MLFDSSRSVMVALVYEPERGFFLGFNEKWRGYTLPMTRLRPTDVDAAAAARPALRDAVEQPLRSATARLLEYVVHEGRSGRTGRDALYRYQVFEVDPNETLPDDGFGGRHGFITYERLLAADLVTWSTRIILRELMENQQVAVAVISRQGATEREYLMICSPSYNGYFFPASRFRTDTRPTWEAVEAVRGDTGYQAPIRPGPAVVVEDVHSSPRYGRERRFVFHVVPVSLPAVQLGKSPNTLEERLHQTEAVWRWVSESELADPAANDLSATVTPLLPAVRQVAG